VIIPVLIYPTKAKTHLSDDLQLDVLLVGTASIATGLARIRLLTIVRHFFS
jgi:hypothetical protein